MNIAWKYIDRIAATKAALRDYDSMKAIIDSTPDNLKDMYEQMTVPRSAIPTGLPTAHNPQTGEDILSSQLDKLDIFRDRYNAAVEYMSWFEPAWNALTAEEQHILREFYAGASCRSGATSRLMGEYHVSESHVERIRRKALCRLQLLLFG